MTPEQYARLRSNLMAALMAALTRLWGGLGSWHEPNVARFQRDALPVLAGSQRALGQLTAVFVAGRASQARGRQVPPPTIPDGLLTDVRDGVSLAEEYRRPFEQTWYGLSQGEPLEQATDRGRVRLLGLADLDTQVTEARASQAAMEATDAQWWRRVPQGEKTCLLCLVASTQAYHVADLKALHGGCDCICEPQYTKSPRDRVVDEETLTKAYAAVRDQTGAVSTSAEVLRTLLADMTSFHSEIGPILVTPRGNRAERARVTRPDER